MSHGSFVLEMAYIFSRPMKSTKTQSHKYSFPFSSREISETLAALEGNESFVLLESTKISPENSKSILFTNPVDRLICHPDDSPAGFFRKAEKFLANGYYLAGWFSYEFGYLLEPSLSGSIHSTPGDIFAEILVFREPAVFDHAAGRAATPSSWPSVPQPSGQDDYSLSNLRLNQNQNDYFKTIDAIKSYIAAGDTYQVNYTLKYLFEFKGSTDRFYLDLRDNQSVSYGAYLKSGDRRILSFSPELFFRKDGKRCTVRPMKGTIRRGQTHSQDQEYKDFLKNDPKNRSENIMIVDLLRNDLGRLCEMGTVETTSLFDVETYETLHQMTSSINGELRGDVTLSDLFTSLFPCGSVTGAPKIRTMEIIRELELENRGVYTGAIGYISPDGNACFNVPIRTVALRGATGEMGVGSGIVFDSKADAEWEECRLKGQFLSAPKDNHMLIETLLWDPRQGYWLLDLHLDRIIRSAAHFRYPAAKEAIREKLLTASKGFDEKKPQRVRLTLERNGSLDATASPCALPPRTRLEPSPSGAPVADITISKSKTSPEDIFLFHKTTKRKIYDTERQRATDDGFFEIIFENTRGEITEGSISNIFIRKGEKFITPPSACGLLDGIFRQHLLGIQPEILFEEKLTREDLDGADEIFIGNSVRGLVKVRLKPS